MLQTACHSGQSPNGKEVFGSFDYYQWPHDLNLTGSVLLNMLSRWCERYQPPPVLYLQLDNCVKENKNQYVLWLLALLVGLEIFEKVKILLTKNFAVFHEQCSGMHRSAAIRKQYQVKDAFL